jgi:hypothetical protein
MCVKWREGFQSAPTRSIRAKLTRINIIANAAGMAVARGLNLRKSKNNSLITINDFDFFRFSLPLKPVDRQEMAGKNE